MTLSLGHCVLTKAFWHPSDSHGVVLWQASLDLKAAGSNITHTAVYHLLVGPYCLTSSLLAVYRVADRPAAPGSHGNSKLAWTVSSLKLMIVGPH